MALDIQYRPAQHGHRRHHTCHETETSRVILQADPIKNGGITVPHADELKTGRHQRDVLPKVFDCVNAGSKVTHLAG